ncbi:MAG: hypothetical protein K2K23_01560 [Muribaculaceae bacterium]|nr:hypothetical protein [Muribaculaceae bacterium]
MNKKNIPLTIPEDVLDEMEQLQVLGGETANVLGTYFLAGCNRNTYCGGGNCVAGCGSEDEEDEDV